MKTFTPNKYLNSELWSLLKTSTKVFYKIVFVGDEVFNEDLFLGLYGRLILQNSPALACWPDRHPFEPLSLLLIGSGAAVHRCACYSPLLVPLQFFWMAPSLPLLPPKIFPTPSNFQSKKVGWEFFPLTLPFPVFCL